MADITRREPMEIVTGTETTQFRPGLVEDEQGAIGYILMWLLGVPASLLFVVFLLRGCN
jgi:hypothetical protein